MILGDKYTKMRASLTLLILHIKTLFLWIYGLKYAIIM